jgi:DNA/RNA-binding domain of Phe-tRNA-synthetase-like protein
LKGTPLTDDEKKILDERVAYAKVWLERYAPEEVSMKLSDLLPENVRNLTGGQQEFLRQVIPAVEQHTDAEQLQTALYEIAKTSGMSTKDAFAAVYTALLGKTHGPKAAWLLLHYPKDVVVERLREASAGTFSQGEPDTPVIHKKPELFEITKEVKEAYPSISVGVAIIRNVRIGKSDPELEKEKAQMLATLTGITTGQISAHPEVASYRKLYKEMGIDWHSRRPSPEALLRRIATGKGLYQVNTCVDAYNLVVLRHRVSVGAFDFDRIVFPTELRFAGEGDEILLHGDGAPTRFTSLELAYYDEKGGYNIDFNFRDSQRTLVTEETKNLWINVEGVFDIQAHQVEAALKESVRMIVKYCGGNVEFAGLVV